MIVDTMTWEEVSKELGKSYNIVTGRHMANDKLLSKLMRALVKKQISIGYYSKSIVVNFSNITFLSSFRVEEGECYALHTCAMFTYRKSKCIALFIGTDDRKSKTVILTKHFLERYRERNNTQTNTFEDLARFILLTETPASMGVQKGYRGKAFALTTGIGLTESEHEDSALVLNTYVHRSMLHGEQIDKYENGLEIAALNNDIEYRKQFSEKFNI